MKQTGASYQDTAIEFNMNNIALIANWNSKFLQEGIEGLQEKVKGRPPMTIWMFRHKYYDSTRKHWKKKKSGFKIEKAALKALMEVNAATLRGETKHIG